MSEAAPEEVEFNFDATLGTEPEPVVEPTGSAAPTTGGNPAWQEVLSIIPKEFQGQVTPHFQKWDQNVQQLVEKARNEAVAPYTAYQKFVEQKADPSEIEAALQIWNQINSDPLAIYNRMTPMLQQMGLLEAAKAAAEAEAAEEPDPVQQKLTTLEQQQKALIESLQQGKQQEEIKKYAEQADAQIKSEFAQIESKTGPLPAWLREEVINRASMMMDRDNVDSVSLVDAFNEIQQVRQQMLANRPGQQAPRVVPSGGGYPAPQTDKSALQTLDGRSKAVADIIARYQNT